jgi:hypothetical protein
MWFGISRRRWSSRRKIAQPERHPEPWKLHRVALRNPLSAGRFHLEGSNAMHNTTRRAAAKDSELCAARVELAKVIRRAPIFEDVP